MYICFVVVTQLSHNTAGTFTEFQAKYEKTNYKFPEFCTKSTSKLPSAVGPQTLKFIYRSQSKAIQTQET